MEQSQAKFEGWAVVELFGHQREVGFVTTQYFGDKAMFQIDVPELPEREIELASGQYTESGWAEKGEKVRRESVEGRSRLINPNAVYAMNPCTEAAARKLIDQQSRTVRLAELPENRRLREPDEIEEEEIEDEEVSF